MHIVCLRFKFSGAGEGLTEGRGLYRTDPFRAGYYFYKQDLRPLDFMLASLYLMWQILENIRSHLSDHDSSIASGTYVVEILWAWNKHLSRAWLPWSQQLEPDVALL